MTDIVKSLRQASLNQGDYRWEAADEIERLKDGEARLRAALEEVKALVFGANHSETRYPLARAALEGK